MSTESKIDLEQIKELLCRANIAEVLESYLNGSFYKEWELATEFFNIAQRDLEASKTLYRIRDYSNAAFHLQQSVEKSTKGLALCLGYAKSNDVRGARHNTPEIFLVQLRKSGVLQKLRLDELLVSNINVSSNTNLHEIEKAIGKEETKIYVASLSKEQIHNLMRVCRQINEVIVSRMDAIKDIIKNNIQSILKILKDCLQKQYKRDIKQLSDDDLVKILDSLLKFLAVMNSVFNSLYVLSIITYPHAVYTRYPDGKMNPQNYKKGFGIVDEMKNLHGELDRCLKLVNSHLNDLLRG